MKKNNLKKIYILLIIFVFSISTIGSTYAYWAASASSVDNDIQASSSIYSISMDIQPLYSDFSFIPMDDQYALKALTNKCKDKYDRGACSAYKINIYGYNENLNYISGIMDVNLNNIENLSYMMLEETTEYKEESCVNIDEKIYCVAKEATSVMDGVKLSLGDQYSVNNTTEKNLLLLIWLTNLEESQNEKNIGNFDAIITFSMGSGGEIKGSISSVLEENRDKLQSEE